MPDSISGPLPADVLEWLHATFPPDERDDAFAILTAATDHLGKKPNERLLRCAAIGSRGTMKGLREMVALLKTDYRDVVVAGEYEMVDHKLVRVRDLSSQPITLKRPYLN